MMAVRRILVLALVAATLPLRAAEPPTSRPAGALREAVRMQRDTRRSLLDLIQTMHQVSLQVEKSDPQAAKAIEAAAASAEQAFIADDMEKVIKLLEAGLVVPADATQAVVVRKLRGVLEVLRSGGDDLEARLILLEQLGRLMDALKEILHRQRELERQSHALAYGGATIDRLSAAAAQARALRADMQTALQSLRKLEFDPLTQQLSAARRAIDALQRRHEALAGALTEPFPSPDAMAANIVSANDLASEAIAVRVSVKTALNDPALSARDLAANVEAALAKVSDELKRVGTVLVGDKLDEAKVAAAEARAHLNGAADVLERGAATLKGAEAMARVLADLRPAAAQYAQLQELVDREAPVEADGADADRPAAPLRPRGFFIGSPVRPGAGTDEPSMPAPATRPLRTNPLASASANLGRFEKEAAITSVEQAGRDIRQWLVRFDDAREQVLTLRQDPQFPQQQAKQAEVARGIGLLARDQNPLATRPTTAPAASRPSAPSMLPGESQAILGRAAAAAMEAADLLGKPDAAAANARQGQVIGMLEKVLDLAANEMARVMAVLEEELSDEWIAWLERLVSEQKRINLDTIAVHEKRLPDGTFRRPEQLALVAIAGSQDRVSTELDAMKLVMQKAVSAHVQVSFPPIMPVVLRLVKEDIAVVVNRLQERDPGVQTQRRQKDIEERLEGMLNAMRSAKADSTRPSPQWADNGMGNPDVSGAKTRSSEIQLLMVMQSQINRRTAELDEARSKGRDDVRAELSLLAAQQTEIARAIETMLKQDLELFANPGRR
mgnify:CR=1 FL=1